MFGKCPSSAHCWSKAGSAESNPMNRTRGFSNVDLDGWFLRARGWDIKRHAGQP
jgi:hypothetical protein